LDQDVGRCRESKEEEIFESSIFYSRKMGVPAQKKNESMRKWNVSSGGEKGYSSELQRSAFLLQIVTPVHCFF
jgi:hypothetical protein